jgi:hypothetical protein
MPFRLRKHERHNLIYDVKNYDVSEEVFIVDLRMINMSSECEYDWYWKISACSTEYDVCDSFASLTHQQTSYSGSADGVHEPRLVSRFYGVV